MGYQEYSDTTTSFVFHFQIERFVSISSFLSIASFHFDGDVSDTSNGKPGATCLAAGSRLRDFRVCILSFPL